MSKITIDEIIAKLSENAARVPTIEIDGPSPESCWQFLDFYRAEWSMSNNVFAVTDDHHPYGDFLKEPGDIFIRGFRFQPYRHQPGLHHLFHDIRDWLIERQWGMPEVWIATESGEPRHPIIRFKNVEQAVEFKLRWVETLATGGGI